MRAKLKWLLPNVSVVRQTKTDFIYVRQFLVKVFWTVRANDGNDAVLKQGLIEAVELKTKKS
jgi:hypothetical protein